MVPDHSSREVHIGAPVARVWHLQVVERGLSDLEMSAQEQAAHARDNLRGWRGGLAGLREDAHGAAAPR